ncbi:MAG TPA: matrixin family metalloprotease [Polyangiaceae bacterium]
MGRRHPKARIQIKFADSANDEESPPRWSPSTRPRSFAPSLRPNSIFTLRPLYHTERPPGDPEGKPAKTPRAKRTWHWVAGGLVVGLGLAGLVMSRVAHEPSRAPVVSINGTPQLRQSLSGEAQRWATDSRVRVIIDPSIDSLGRGASDAVMNAFGTWLGSGAHLPKLQFETRRVATPKVARDGVSSVVYAPITIPEHRNDLAITIGYSDANTGRIVEADVVINSAKSFAVLDSREERGTKDDDDDDDDDESSSCGNRYDLQNVITHEVGHFFGLGEDSDDLKATMFFKTGKCELMKRDLEPLDTSTMAGLYMQDTQSSEAETAGGCAVSAAGSERGWGPLGALVLMLMLMVRNACTRARLRCRS